MMNSGSKRKRVSYEDESNWWDMFAMSSGEIRGIRRGRSENFKAWSENLEHQSDQIEVHAIKSTERAIEEENKFICLEIVTMKKNCDKIEWKPKE